MKDLYRRIVNKCQWWMQSSAPNRGAPPPALLAALMVVATVLVWVCTRSPKTSELLDERTTADTFVPRGLQFVPIEVENYQGLDDVLGSRGVVDLYTTPDEPNSRPRCVARRIKIVRAPLNPHSFAVVATDQQAPQLLRQGHFFVVVRNPKEVGTEIEDNVTDPKRPLRSTPRSRIVIESMARDAAPEANDSVRDE